MGNVQQKWAITGRKRANACQKVNFGKCALRIKLGHYGSVCFPLFCGGCDTQQYVCPAKPSIASPVLLRTPASKQSAQPPGGTVAPGRGLKQIFPGRAGTRMRRSQSTSQRNLWELLAVLGLQKNKLTFDKRTGAHATAQASEDCAKTNKTIHKAHMGLIRLTRQEHTPEIATKYEKAKALQKVSPRKGSRNQKVQPLGSWQGMRFSLWQPQM